MVSSTPPLIIKGFSPDATDGPASVVSPQPSCNHATDGQGGRGRYTMIHLDSVVASVVDGGFAVSTQDMTKIRELAEQLNEITNGRALRIAIMEAVQRLIGGNLVGLNQVNSLERSVVVLHWPNEPAAKNLSELVTSFIDDHPLVTYYETVADRAPRIITQEVRAEDWRHRPFYREVFCHIDAKYQLAIPLFASSRFPAMANAYAINRESRVSDFSERELGMAMILQGILMSQHRRFPNDADLSLTMKQLDVLALLAEGRSQQMAAKVLGISETALKKRIRCAAQRLGTQTITATIHRATKLGMI